MLNDERTMKKLVVLLGIFGLPVLTSGQVTVSPRVEYQNTPDVKITKVELTERYTKVFMRFTANPRQGTPRDRYPDMYRFRNPSMSTQSIWIDPNTRLYKPGDISKKFKFLKAEGIPVAPERKIVAPNEVVEFVTYFERLSPGIEEFDYFEGKSTNGGQTWNFEGVRINNPLNPKKTPAPSGSTPQPGPEAADEKTPAAPAGFYALKGTVLDEKTGDPVAATVTYTDNGDTIRISSSSGKYQLGLTAGKSYTLRVTAKGFIGNEYSLDLASDSTGNAAENGILVKDFRLRPLSVGESFTLNNIYFATGEYELLSESNAELDKLVSLLKENPALHITVEGHTDNLGDVDKNIKLSLDRANSVARYLTAKGIVRERIEVKGYGPARPVSTGTSEAERQKNRRVEILISKN